MSRGAFITLEGIEGVGKTTALTVIEERLQAAGVHVRLTREPGGTKLGERVREWVLHGDHGRLSAEVETLLMFAARAQHIGDVIAPALARGEWVVCDRFSDATLAYQGGGRGADPRLLDVLRESVLGSLEPDLTLLLDAPVDVGFARIRERAHDHFEREERAFFERVREAYLDIAARASDRVRIIDATQDVDTVRADIARTVDAFVAVFRRSA